MLFFYGMLALGLVLFLLGVGLTILALIGKVDSYFELAMPIGMVIVGVFLLQFTMPSLKQMITKDFKVSADECTVFESTESGKRNNASYRIDYKDGQQFHFEDGPYLDSYGEKFTYYCEVKQTKDEMFEIDYKVYDEKGGKLLAPIY